MEAADLSILRQAAYDGTLDLAEWPALLLKISSQMTKIVYHTFPIPTTPHSQLSQVSSLSQLDSTPNGETAQTSSSLAPLETPSSGAAAATLPVAALQSSPPHSSTLPTATPTNSNRPSSPQTPAARIPDSQPPTTARQQTESATRPPNPLGASLQSDISLDNAPSSKPAHFPPELDAFLAQLLLMLEQNFARAPPYTLQRFSELLLNPTAHYRTLPSYMRALDRTLAVASPIDIFPLSEPTEGPDSNMTGAPNAMAASAPYLGSAAGVSASTSDGDFNGAALTPIPWARNSRGGYNGQQAAAAAAAAMGLGAGNGVIAGANGAVGNGGGQPDLRTETTAVIDGPHGAGSIETVTVALNGGTPSTAIEGNLRERMAHQIAGGADAHQAMHEYGDEQLFDDGDADGDIDVEGALPSESMLAHQTVPSHDQTGGPMETDDIISTDTHRDADADVDADADAEAEADESEIPHARGPEEIGMADMGPQDPRDPPRTLASDGAHQGGGAQGSASKSPGDGDASGLHRPFDAEAAVGRPGEGERTGDGPVVIGTAPPADAEGELGPESPPASSSAEPAEPGKSGSAVGEGGEPAGMGAETVAEARAEESVTAGNSKEGSDAEVDIVAQVSEN